MKHHPHPVRSSSRSSLRDQLGVIVYAIGIISMLLYSYTQIDLNLTISRVPFIMAIVDVFRGIGYFNRPVSSALYIAVIIIMSLGYIALLDIARRKAMGIGTLFRIAGITALVLLVSYPAFSYDFFNYLFTARTVILYHANPYAVIPLHYSGVDPYLSFMRWTHLASAYTPVWIGVSLIPYLIGLNIFIAEVISLKAFLAIMYLLMAWGVWKISDDAGDTDAAWKFALVAFNPLVIIEALISSHNDTFMMAISILALVLAKRKTISFFLLSLSAGIKMMTIALIPSFLFGWNTRLAFIGMMGGLVLVSFTREILPWYLLWVVPFWAIVAKPNGFLTYALFGVTTAFIVRYIPFLYLGAWDPPAMEWKNILSSFVIIATTVAYVIARIRTHRS